MKCPGLILLACAAASAAQAPDFVRALEPEIERAMLEGKIPSVTLALVSGDRIVWTGAYGYANLWARTPATTSTVYLIGSTFKAMSTVALLQFLEQGKFRLDDPVGDFLGDLKIQNEDPARRVTFRHLLTHTSGLPADFGPHPVWGDSVPLTLDQYLKQFLKVTGPPLEKVTYSNNAFTLIGYLVQKFSGQEYRKHVREKIFTPLEMSNTAFAPTPEMEERLAIPYTVDEKTGRPVAAARLKANVWPAGIVYGTVLDQAHWLIANLNSGEFRGRRIIGEKTLAQMHARQFDQFKGPIEKLWGSDEAGFGLTWWTDTRGGERYFAHSGSVPGFTAFLEGNRDRRLGFAALTNGNRAHPHLIRLSARALELMKRP